MTLPVPIQKLPIKKADPDWRHIVGLHVENGDFALVWLGHDTGTIKNTGHVYLYDTLVLPSGTPFAVVADAINRRRATVAYEEKAEEIIKELRGRGCIALPKGYEDTESACLVDSDALNTRIADKTFVLYGQPHTEWGRQYEAARRRDGLVPQVGYPLLNATRHALHHLIYARPLGERFAPIKYPKNAYA